MSEPHELNSPTSIADDLACVSCSYNLRGLSVNGNCPECGATILDSMAPDRIPDSLRSDVLAMAATYGAMLLVLPMCFLAIIDHGGTLSLAAILLTSLRIHVLLRLRSHLSGATSRLQIRIGIFLAVLILELLAALMSTVMTAGVLLIQRAPNYGPAAAWVGLIVLSIGPFSFVTADMARQFQKLTTLRMIRVSAIFAITGPATMAIALAALASGAPDPMVVGPMIAGLTMLFAAPMLSLATAVDLVERKRPEPPETTLIE